jgi:hypothetical protein
MIALADEPAMVPPKRKSLANTIGLGLMLTAAISESVGLWIAGRRLDLLAFLMCMFCAFLNGISVGQTRRDRWYRRNP